MIQRLNAISGLPTLPEVALKVQQLVFSDDSNAFALARIIEQDPALTAMILRVANSSYYASGNRISTVPMAITRLGFNEIGHIIIATSIIKSFTARPGSNAFDYHQFWRHALTAAHMASMTTRFSSVVFTPEERQTLYLAGLLHDIGILVYDQFFYEEFKEIVDYAVKNEVSFLEAESAVTPKETHAAVGAALLEMWKLSPIAINGVRFHHTPEKASDKEKSIPFAIYLSEYILCNSGIGSFEGQIDRHEGSILDELNIDAESLPGYLLEAQNQVDKSDLILAIDGSAPVSNQDPGKPLRAI
ncbi:MAG: HDOD domain-containing protein [Chitinispirillia bacterium]|nr:HDOD domain-containing protein [Chitinispirillia bacterium]MCL2219851.1 HDOD domain-containing protein [Chitinispirillia bacterium]MCL2267670.1 HDOD domain-containing protein [Chitinispirillia bacterium]